MQKWHKEKTGGGVVKFMKNLHAWKMKIVIT